ncbi:MAG: S-layer homology domain-containing protein, partial [Oscillospiraceae bacterium]|nr:S-layer homology domain-containing protein [Oscillospiraceae bacterium]
LGCIAAVNLDGGGSTTAVASMPDGSAAKLLNSPSDKSQRKVSNHLVLLAPGGATGEPAGVYLSAAAPAVLAGHTVKLAANVTDTHYYPIANLPVTYYATSGKVMDGVFTAPQQGGIVSVTAFYGQFSAQRDIRVVDAPDSISIRSSDNASAVSIIAGDSMQLSVSAAYNHRALEIFPEDVNWSVDPKLGTIDEHGLFTASNQAGSGTITATRGSVRATIPVTVEANHPFSDLDGHWAEAYMGQLYQQKVLTGEAAEDGSLYAYPDRSLTRAEFSVLLARYLGIDTAAYAGTDTPFTDLTGVESWAGGAIRAMYSRGIVNGVDASHFAPQAPLERAQAAAMLGRALGLTEASAEETPGIDPGTEPVPEPEPTPEEDQTPPADTEIPGWLVSRADGGTELSRQLLANAGLPAGFDDYPDASQVPEYAQMYFRILIAKGALDSRDGKLLPAASITRAEICKALVVMQAK